MQTHESKTSILAISAEPALQLITLRTKPRTRQDALQRRDRTWARYSRWDSDTLIACFQPTAVAMIYPQEKLRDDDVPQLCLEALYETNIGREVHT